MAGPRPAAAAGGRAFGVVCAFERACAASALAGALALAAGMIVVLADILTRRLLATPLVGVNDLVQLAVVASACLALPLAFARGAHVAVEFVTRRWPGGVQRGLVRTLALVEAGFLLLLFVYGVEQARSRLSLGDVSPTLGLSVAVYWLPYLFGIGLSIPAALLALLDPRPKLASGAPGEAGDP